MKKTGPSKPSKRSRSRPAAAGQSGGDISPEKSAKMAAINSVTKNSKVEANNLAKKDSPNSSGADNDLSKDGDRYLYPFDSKSLAQLAVGSSVVIATLLSLPDGIALIPGAPSLISWALRLIGNWVIGAVLWFVGFSALVQLLRLVSRGVIASPQGLKLSRFDRLINWEDIQAISLEPNDFFTRLFSLKEPARRLTVYFRLTAKNKILAHVLFPNFVPSFFFTRETFDSLVRTVFQNTQILPVQKLPAELQHELALFAFRPEQINTVRNTARWQKRQRVLVTCIIAVSLIVFLGRKAATNFAYNSGSKAYREGRLEKAREFYDLSVKLEPTFAAAWNALGQCEFHLAETNLTSFDRARKDWTVAILCKPDFVEPKLNLARLAIFQRRFFDAADLIEHATFFDPQNLLSLLDKAELDIRRGKSLEGLKEARLAVSEAEGARAASPSSREFAFLGHCLIAQAKLNLGDLAGAAAELKPFSEDPTDYHNGENINYMYIVKSRLLAAGGDWPAAGELAKKSVIRQPRNEEALAQSALAEVELGHYQQAESLMAAARALLVPDPWLSIAYGNEMLRAGRRDDAIAAYRDALVVPDSSQDAYALSFVRYQLKAIQDGLLPPSQSQSLTAKQSEELAALIEDAANRAISINPNIFKVH